MERVSAPATPSHRTLAGTETRSTGHILRANDSIETSVKMSSVQPNGSCTGRLVAGGESMMVVATDRLLYIGTENGLFEAKPRGGEYELTALPFEVRGTMRTPLVVDKDDPSRLYAGTTKDGMLVSEDAGRTWREINNGLIYKEVWSLVQHPTTGDLYVGTGPASVFKSTDRGESWQDSEQFRSMPESIDWTFPRAPHVAHVKGLGVCGQDPDIVFGAVEEGWIVRSRDGGQTWATIKQGTEFDSHYVTVLPHDPSIILATSGMGTYRSTDGGDSFTQITEGLDRRYFAAPVVHPDRPNVMLRPPRRCHLPGGDVPKAPTQRSIAVRITAKPGSE